jgi:hypothetical protein
MVASAAWNFRKFSVAKNGTVICVRRVRFSASWRVQQMAGWRGMSFIEYLAMRYLVAMIVVTSAAVAWIALPALKGKSPVQSQGTMAATLFSVPTMVQVLHS